MSGRPAPTAAEIFGAETSLTDDVTHNFRRLDEGHYQLTLDQLGIEFSVDRLRRKWDELVGELTVRCDLAGARTFNGVLSVADFNFSNLRARQERARYLAGRAQAQDLDWGGLLEEFVQRVLTAERTGEPAVLLRDVPRPTPDQQLNVDGLTLLMRHPMVLFGDGGAAKSYLALYCAGRLERDHGVRVGLFDWELAGEDHRDRLERLFGSELPGIRYARCAKPLVHEIDRLRRIVRDEALDYVILDSIAFACDGPPEAAEVAGRYFQAVRQLGIVGSLHVAHVSKADGADRKPFGSTFWHNGARATWNVKLSETPPGANQIIVGLYNRKANLGGLRPAAGFKITFTDDRTTFRRVELADVPDLAAVLSLSQRVRTLLSSGARTRKDIAAELKDANPESLRRVINRGVKQGHLIRFPNTAGDEQFGLAQRGS